MKTITSLKEKIKQILEYPKTKYIVLAVTVLISLFYLGSVLLDNYNDYTRTVIINRGLKDVRSLPIQSGDCYEQEFSIEQEICNGITVTFGTKGKKLKQGSFRVFLYTDGGKVLEENHLISEIQNHVPFYLFCNEQLAVGEYKLELNFLDKNPNEELMFYTADIGAYPASQTRVNGEVIDHAIAIQALSPAESTYKIIILVLSLLIILIFIILWLTVSKKEMTIQKFFVISATVLGMVYLIIIPIGDKPDAPVHIDYAYAVSNDIMGIQNEDGHISMRSCDSGYYAKYYSYLQMNKGYMNQYYNFFTETDFDTELVSGGTFGISEAKSIYLFAGLGLTIGRLLHLNLTLTFMFGQFFNLMFYIFCVWYAIKKIPVGKELAFVIATMPMSLQQASSFSYDSPVNGLVILMTALVLYIYSQKSIFDKKLDLLILVGCSLYLFPAKNHAFVPVIIFAWLFLGTKLLDRFASKKKKMIVAISISVCVLGGVFVLYAMLSGKMAVSGYFSSDELNYTAEKGYDLTYFLENPGKFFSVLWETFRRQLLFYWQTFVGCVLGALDIALPVRAGVPYLIAILATALKNSRDKLVCGKGGNAVLLLGGVLYIGALFCVMLFSWSRVSQGVIEGIQGRYFIPVAVMVFLIFKHIKVSLNAKYINYLLAFTVLAHLQTILCVYAAI